MMPETAQDAIIADSARRSTILGHVEEITPSSLRGWVFDQSQTKTPVLLDIWLHDRFIARIPADTFREDLALAGIGDGCCGFSFRFPRDKQVTPEGLRVLTDQGVPVVTPQTCVPEDPITSALTSQGADSPLANFLSPAYQRHNYRRIEHLAVLLFSAGVSVANTTVLEVGAGIGDHTSFFLDRDCTVVAFEPRPENVQVFKHRYEKHPRHTYLRVERAEVERLSSFPLTGFDVVYTYGMLYHCAAPAAVIADLCRLSAGLVLLETRVSTDWASDEIGIVEEDRSDVSNSFEGNGCRPTRKFVLQELRKHMPHVYLSRTQPWHEEFPTVWTRPNTRSSASRAVFVASRCAIESPYLITGVPTVCTRF